MKSPMTLSMMQTATVRDNSLRAELLAMVVSVKNKLLATKACS